ncbi:MAG: response regulator [Elusimicrobia bacterium]|nr:response regulator [Elusimicrobiota bacterium]
MGNRILIIDDDQSMHDIVGAVLKSMGHEVESALDGAQGTMKAQQLWPDLIVLDFEMPGGGGEVVFERLRANERLSSVPVLFLSSLPLMKQVTRVEVSRNVRFLNKPVDLAELRRLVTELLAPPKHA